MEIKKELGDLTIREYLHIMASECYDLTYCINNKLLLKMGNLMTLSNNDLKIIIEYEDNEKKKGE